MRSSVYARRKDFPEYPETRIVVSPTVVTVRKRKEKVKSLKQICAEVDKVTMSSRCVPSYLEERRIAFRKQLIDAHLQTFCDGLKLSIPGLPFSHPSLFEFIRAMPISCRDSARGVEEFVRTQLYALVEARSPSYKR